MKCLKAPHHPWSSPSSCWLYIKCWSNRIHEIVFLLCRSGGTLLIWKIMAPFVSTSGILKESRSDLAMIWFGCKTFLVLIRLRRRRQQWWCCCPIKKHSFSAYLAVLCLKNMCASNRNYWKFNFVANVSFNGTCLKSCALWHKVALLQPFRFILKATILFFWRNEGHTLLDGDLPYVLYWLLITDMRRFIGGPHFCEI